MKTPGLKPRILLAILAIGTPMLNANTVPGQGIVFTFDSTNLVGALEIDLKEVRWTNDTNDCRLSFREEGAGTPTALYSGGTEGAADQTIIFSPPPVRPAFLGRA